MSSAWCETGRITPMIGAHYSLEQIEQAAARLEAGDLVGRIVLTRLTTGFERPVRTRRHS